MLELKSILVDTKSAWIDFPGMDGFSVEVANLSRTELTKLRKRCISNKFSRKERGVVENFDDEKFVREFSAATVKNWKGLKLKYLESLILVDLDNNNLEEDLVYSEENAQILVSQSAEFDSWLNEVVFDLDNFRSKGKGKAVDSPK